VVPYKGFKNKKVLNLTSTPNSSPSVLLSVALYASENNSTAQQVFFHIRVDIIVWYMHIS
jgi:hypothetical protein